MPMPTAIEDHWIWSAGGFWSVLVNFGDAGRGFWNDVPRHPPPECFKNAEIHAWIDINAFVALLNRDGLAHYTAMAIWVM
jgi:hypothetical protein